MEAEAFRLHVQDRALFCIYEVLSQGDSHCIICTLYLLEIVGKCVLCE